MYGWELVLDLKECDTSRFNRDGLRTFFHGLCEVIDMEPEDLHFWDDEGIPPEECQTNPQTKGTSSVGSGKSEIQRRGVQFILTSTIVVHTLELRREVYLNVFSCKQFDAAVARAFCVNYFDGTVGWAWCLERGR